MRCKGRGHCGRESCAILTKADAWTKHKDNVQKSDFEGASPSVFIGRYGYPNVNVGLLSRPDGDETSWKLDAPRYWAARSLGIPDIVDFRSSLINSRFRSPIKGSSAMLDLSKEIGMASKSVELEVSLKDRPKFRLNTDPYRAPTGPNASLKKAEITSNPFVDRKVDRVVDDDDLKATGAMTGLFKKGFTESFLTKLLSTGNIGVKTERKLVPTRWSITAVDDTVGKDLLNNVRTFPETDHLAYFGGYLGNYYLVLMFPEVWSYELFEVYMPKTSWNTSGEYDFTTDYEPFAGRKKYAENCAGGYYAARLPILEKLSQMKRQSSVLAIRIITGEYSLPLGVWVCREAARKTISSKPLSFGSTGLMLDYARSLIRKKFGYDAEKILSGSLLLREMKSQSKLAEFFDHDA